MEDKIQLEYRDEYLFVKGTGEYGLEKVYASIDQMDKGYQEQPFTKILYDFKQMAGKIGIMDRQKIGNMQSDFPLEAENPPCLITVNRSCQINFLETFLPNRGTQIRVFSDDSEALEWLLQ